MNRYKFLYLFWLLPLIFLFLLGQQLVVYYGIDNNLENGDSYTAEIINIDIKRIATQTSGYIVLKFDTSDGSTIKKQLSLPYEMVSGLQELRVVPIRYKPGGWQELIMLPTIEKQKNLVWSNALMAFVSLLITVGIAYIAQRFAKNKIREGNKELVIERID